MLLVRRTRVPPRFRIPFLFIYSLFYLIFYYFQAFSALLAFSKARCQLKGPRKQLPPLNGGLPISVLAGAPGSSRGNLRNLLPESGLERSLVLGGPYQNYRPHAKVNNGCMCMCVCMCISANICVFPVVSVGLCVSTSMC